MKTLYQRYKDGGRFRNNIAPAKSESTLAPITIRPARIQNPTPRVSNDSLSPAEWTAADQSYADDRAKSPGQRMQDRRDFTQKVSALAGYLPGPVGQAAMGTSVLLGLDDAQEAFRNGDNKDGFLNLLGAVPLEPKTLGWGHGSLLSKIKESALNLHSANSTAMALTNNYGQSKKALGGSLDKTDVDNQAQFSGAASTVAGIGNGILDAFDSPNEYGHQAVGTTAAKSALSFGAAGASVGGPVGAGIGAALGLGVGLFNGIKAKRQETGMRAQKFTTMQTNEMNRSSAAIASDPNLITGYKNAQMFAGGGQLPTATASAASALGNPSSDRNMDTIPDYLYYIKAMQSGNSDAANQMIGHLNGIRTPQTIANLQFLGKSLKTSNVYDIAKRNVGTETDPQMKLLYNQLNQNPGLVDSMNYGLQKPAGDMAVKAAGGTIKAPLAQAYMNGGNAKSLSSDTTELQGNSHAEGGIEIPQVGAEVEGGETTADNFVFSKQLGFAQLHKPIAKAKGIIEKKPQTAERVNAMKLLNKQENKLALSQEYLKQRMGIR